MSTYAESVWTPGSIVSGVNGFRSLHAEITHTHTHTTRIAISSTRCSLGLSVHFISGPGKFQAPYFMCALANFTEIS